jgi:PAS domain S-box-containing protein
MNPNPSAHPLKSELLSGDQRFQLLVEAIKDYAIYLLDPYGYINSWNTGAQRFKGYTAEEIIGQHFSRFYTPEDRESGLPQRALETAAREGTFEAEGWRVRKDGTRFWTSVVIDPILDPSGNLIGFAKITRDITAQREAREALERGREALNQAQKMEAVGRLTGGVAHDFNNLLTIIRSSAELLRRQNLPEEKRNRFLQAICETADRAALLTRQLLAFARRQPLHPEFFDVADRVRGLEQIIQTSMGSPVKVVLDFPDEELIVEADPNQFETAVLNMVINARDAMPSGGTLRLHARPVTGVPPALRQGGAKREFVALYVQDSGTGIEPETLRRIFEPFFTTKPVNKGTGLGLSQVYGFAKQSGGDVDVETRVGEGTTFVLYLPRAAQAHMTPAGDAGTAADGDEIAERNVLLVEDNETVGRFAVNLLTELGQQVTWATHGREALSILEAHHADFDLVFSDVVMPGMNGIELGTEVRRRWPGLRVVLTSGYSHVIAEEGNHGFELLEKPYSIESLMKILR